MVHLNDIAWVGSALVAALRADGSAADLVVPIRPGASAAFPVRQLLLPVRLAGLLGAALRARTMGPDLVHLHYARHGWVAPLLGAPYVLHCHGSDVRGMHPGRGWGRVVGRAMRGAAAVVYATPDLAAWVAAYRPDGLFLPNPIPIPEAPRAQADGMADLLLGVRLDPVKGTDAIAAVMAALLQKRPATSVTLIAHGSQVARMRAVLGAAARVIAPVPHAAMGALFARHRAVVGQMAVGALGNFELEAMAAGLPTAARFRFPEAYPVPPPVIDSDDSAAVAVELAALLDDEAARSERGAASRAWVAEHHLPARVAERLAAIYAGALADVATA